jgi:hypothetical protein
MCLECFYNKYKITFFCSYTSVLKENNINGHVLLTMTKEDWKDVGVQVFGDIRILVSSVAQS